MSIEALAFLVFAIVALLIIAGRWGEYKGGSYLSLFDLFDGADETVSEAMNAAGHDGRPRTFVLTDGSRYSGMFRDPAGHIIVTDIKPRNVVKVEYPEG